MRSTLLRKALPALTFAVLLAAAADNATAWPAANGVPPQHPSRGGRLVFHDADTERWTPCEGLPGCTQLPSRGNPATGASEAVFRFKAGTPFAAHYHTSPEHVVGIAGIMQYVINGTTYHVGPGDFLYYPGRTVHSGICSSGADCIFHVYDDLPYDIFPSG